MPAWLNKNKILAIFFLTVFLGFNAVAFIATPNALAQQSAGQVLEQTGSTVKSTQAGPPTGDPTEKAGTLLQETGQNIDQKAVLVIKNIAISLLSFVMNRLAYDAAVYLAAGSTGQEPGFQYQSAEEYFQDLGLDIAGETFASLSDLLDETVNIQFDICAPGNPVLRAGLQLGIKSAYQRPEPRCEFQDFVDNWEANIATYQEYAQLGKNPSEFVLNEFKKAYQPGQSELDASIRLNVRVREQVLEAKATQFMDSLAKDGFKDVTDVITGQVETPAALIQRKTESALVEAKQDETQVQWENIVGDDELMAAAGLSALSVFLNTFLSELLTNFYDGLFELDVDNYDVWDSQGVAIGGREAAEDTFKELLTVNFTAIDDFNAISELLACPGSTSRSIFNCAMDSSFAAALSQAELGTPLTVRDALDQGLLREDWPLIPPDDYAKNQDPYCYTYGYCYANLVKMRKFRIIPIGWEIAANSPYNHAGNPVTLGEVVDSFNDCSSDGQLNANHPWCHLIDPNWVLKAPETSCPVAAPSEVVAGSTVDVRLPYCVDTPSCLAEDDQGNCIGGTGYCTREENVWRFRGDDCPEEYATCLAFENTFTGERGNWLLNSVDFDSCDQNNAGCRWYRVNQFFDDLGTTDTSDDTYSWLPTGDDYLVADRDDDIYAATTTPATYSYDTDGDGADDYDYTLYAFEDRRYFNNDVLECSDEDVGCSELILNTDDVQLNVIANPSFEDDADNNGEPDNWNGVDSADYYVSGPNAIYGADYVNVNDGATSDVYQENIALSASRFYTLSFFTSQVDDATSGEATVDVYLYDTEGNQIDLTGTTVLGDCELSSITINQVSTEVANPGADPTRYSCTFTTPNEETRARVQIANDSGELVFDALMLEEGSLMHDFQTGYGSAELEYEYLRLPPDWLGCTGASTDPAECDEYTKMCSYQDVGCDLYTPADGDPAVPAVISELDMCPAECVGYDTYKQEATLYEEEKFPLYFIPESADICSETEVGCDEFTNLDAVNAGGEGLEYYTSLRMCSKPENTTEEATFFTWEGSDLEGYQLVSWDLLESDLSDSGSYTFASGFAEDNIGAAPCINPVMDSESTIVCDDAGYVDGTDSGIDAIANNTACDEHDDIFANPDCREFYDASGNIHYREFSMTATVTTDCSPYRKTDSTQTDCDISGGYWTISGDCRYNGYAAESDSCAVSANGCRSYTGGAGRNATTIFYDDVEDGSLEEWGGIWFSADAVISNESVASDGHSIRVTNGGDLMTLQLYENNPTDCVDGNLCTLDDGSGSSCEIIGTDETDYCGPLTGGLVQGKTYIFSFWAKGTGELVVQFIDHGGADDAHNFQNFNDYPVELSGGWQLYEVGPLDTSSDDFSDFDDTAVINIYNPTGEFYIDNLQLKEVEDNLTLIKDSWVTPSTCDQTPEGVDSGQYYLGCEAYTDNEGIDWSLYRFTRLCEEDVVGCEAYFDTQNSSSVFAEAYNLTCDGADETAGYSVFAGDLGVCSTDTTVSCTYDSDCSGVSGQCVAATTTACQLDGETVCNIGVAGNQCTFDWQGNFPLPIPENIILGPEAAVVSNDVDLYLVNDGNTSCLASNKGCTEFGVPTFNQDHSEVTAFESIYLLDQPDSYSSQLCDHEALFCEEWSTNQDGNFYFKDPESQTCEWEDSKTIENVEYFGWFKTGTDEPCYTDYLIAGEEYGIWRNGDVEYEGWVAECDSANDRCAEFIDPADTSEGDYPNGTPYYYLNNDKIAQENLSTTEQCNGEISQSEGCVLFNNTTESSLDYNASASYIASNRADLIFGDEPYSGQSPIDCDSSSGGVVETPDGVTIDLCWSQCRYPEYDGVASLSGDYTFGNSCVIDDDCPTYEDGWGNEVIGECVVLSAEPDPSDICPDNNGADAPCPDTKLTNDTNTILRVYRDRQCAEWLACDTAGYAWDERLGSWTSICYSLRACDEYTSTGDTTFCANYPDEEPYTLNMERYSARDVSWYGNDYSGYSVPEILPVAYLGEVNINPTKWCLDTGGTVATQEINGDEWPYTCNSDAECESFGFATCEESDPDYRLGYAVGSCDVDTGEDCYVGVCEATGDRCADDSECESGDECIVGYCEYSDPDSACTSDADCTGAGECKNGICTVVSNSCVSLDDCSTIAPIGYGSRECARTAGAFSGTCIGGSCLVDMYGESFDKNSAEESECRAYPEDDSPFPHELVDTWKDTEVGTPSSLDGLEGAGADIRDAQPYDLTYGYQGANICAPDSEDCMCSYNKASYGNGAIDRYYATDYSESDTLTGICFGGSLDGQECVTNDECGTTDAPGVCMNRESYDLYIGWPGYCLERDSAMNRWSDPNGPGVCLTWLPVDQLISATDLYAKYTEAGFPLEDAYYCVEGGYYRDYYTTGVNMDSDGEIGYYDGSDDQVVQVACAETMPGSGVQDAACDGNDTVGSDYEGCWHNAFCPDGYTAVVGKAARGDSTVDDICDDSSSNYFFGQGGDDCPYICVPDNSYRYDTGESCDDILSELNTPTEEFDGQSCTVDTDESIWGTPVRLIWKIEAAYDDEGNDPRHLERCVARGIPMSYTDTPYQHNWEVDFVDDNTCANKTGKHTLGEDQGDQSDPDPWDSIDDYIWGNTSTSCDDGSADRGFWRLDYTGMSTSGGDNQGAFTEYLGCYSLAQVASEDPAVGNKAYTQRLMFDDAFATQDAVAGNYTGLNYISAALPQYAGQSLFADYYEPVEFDVDDNAITYTLKNDGFEYDGGVPDSMPLPLYTCDSGTLFDGGFGLFVDEDCGSNTYGYPGEVQLPPLYVDDDPFALGVLYELLTLNDEGDAVDGGITPDQFAGFGATQGYNAGWQFLGQFFSQIHDFFVYDWADQGDGFGRGTYRLDDSTAVSYPTDFAANIYEVAAGNDYADDQGLDNVYDAEVDAPVTYSIGTCFGTSCREDEENEITLNDQDHGDIEAGGGRQFSTMKFFVTTDPNQFPIRNIIIDWGDGDTSGSQTNDNFYKAHRGLQDNSQSESKCDGSEWGRTSESCESGYLTYNHNYLCSDAIYNSLDACETGDFVTMPDGKTILVGGPCKDTSEVACVFQPKVHVRDNWGYCTGLCEGSSGAVGGETDDEDLCYDSSGIPTTGRDECSLDCPDSSVVCPKGSAAGSDYATADNPWVYYDGQVYVSPN